MAKIKFGMMMTDARGKLGGQVFSKNRAGAYVRTKVTPKNNRTEFQQASRSILGALSASWSSLTESQRRAWNDAVTDWQTTDIFGDLRKPTGKNLFTGLNKEILQSAGVQINLPPEKEEVPILTIDAATADATAGTITIKTLGDTSGAKIQVWATPAMSQGTTFINDKLRVIGYVSGSNGASVDAGTLYSDRFSAIQTGQNIWVQIKVVLPNGQVSVPVRAKVTISA